MIKAVAIAALLLVFGAGIAHAEDCPPLPPAKVTFKPRVSPIDRDTSLSAKDLAARYNGAPGSVLFVQYEPGISAGTAQSVTHVDLHASGKTCAALAALSVEVGFKRKVLIAKEFADDACETDALAAVLDERIKVEDDVITRIGATVPATYTPEVQAIGTKTGASLEEAVKPISAALSAMLSTEILPAFNNAILAEIQKLPPIDVGKAIAGTCNGETKKLFDKLNGVEKKDRAR